jgi:prepilin-type N-terminal cleavage/methylation domain-containing protein
MRSFTRKTSLRAVSRAFTLVELLVVIAIIGVLVALLLPAIQAAREAARRSQCANNLKQLGLAVQLHHDAKGFFPTGRDGSGNKSVSWAFYCLPYMEQQAIFQARRPGSNDYDEENASVFRVPIPTLFCPSRRSPVADRDFDNNEGAATIPDTAAGKAAGGDYAACAGDGNFGGDAERMAEGLGAFGDNYNPAETGPIFTASKIKERNVTDGLSNTFVIGEKFIAAALPEGVTPAAGAEHAYLGDSAILSGNSKQTVLRGSDGGFPSGVPTVGDNTCFGSEHNQQAHFVLLDGSVKPINYSIERTVFDALACIGDDVPVGSY